jgi:hypothetical protein
MRSYYKNTEGQLFVDPILANHTGLTEITKEQFDQIIAERNKPTTDQLLQQLTQARKEQERQGVTINGIRYAGDRGNRQALQEAIALMDDAGLTEFESWKDSDNIFHANHPLADVRDAYRAIGARRSQLIAAEGEYAAQIIAGTLTDLTETDVVWP